LSIRIEGPTRLSIGRELPDITVRLTYESSGSDPRNTDRPITIAVYPIRLNTQSPTDYLSLVHHAADGPMHVPEVTYACKYSPDFGESTPSRYKLTDPAMEGISLKIGESYSWQTSLAWDFIGSDPGYEIGERYSFVFDGINDSVQWWDWGTLEVRRPTEFCCAIE
jgi:hypothetical protein